MSALGAAARAGESHLRGWLAASSWRRFATTTTAPIAFRIGGRAHTASAFGGIAFFPKRLVYRAPRGPARRRLRNRFPGPSFRAPR